MRDRWEWKGGVQGFAVSTRFANKLTSASALSNMSLLEMQIFSRYGP